MARDLLGAVAAVPSTLLISAVAQQHYTRSRPVAARVLAWLLEDWLLVLVLGRLGAWVLLLLLLL
jgi:hypothetical protein